MHPIYSKLHSIVSDAQLNNINSMTIKMILKEYLQDHILDAIYSNKSSKDLIFYGGTALRKLYSLDRMSEDLDFESVNSVNLKTVADDILVYFKRQKFNKVEYKFQKGKIINRVTFKFEILHELGLSPNDLEKLHVEVEVNQKPKSSNFKTKFTPFMKDQLSIMIKHYDLSVTMTGKVDACLNRVFKKGNTGIKVKGRDYYDLIWYMKNKINLDKDYLSILKLSQKEAFIELDEKVKQISSQDLLFDLQPFFVSKNYIQDWCKSFHKLYDEYREFYK